ncbi:MAG: transketolase C-terminal domain-containing protein [Cloacibacillus sp.]
MSEYYFEIKRNQMEGMKNVLPVYKELSAELALETGRNYAPIEAYRAEDADYLIIIMSSASGVAKDVADELREEGIKAGVLRVRFFRPFPKEELLSLARGKKGIAVLDRSASIGGTAPLAADVKSVLYDLPERVPVQEYIFGLGGRDFYASDARRVFEDMKNDNYTHEARFIGLLEKGEER